MASQVRTGSVVAGFRVEALIDEGAMGAVYLASAPEGGGQVALKLLPAELARDERFRQRFLRESSLAAALDHPHIVATLTSGDEGGVLYLAMAYVEGSNLRMLLRREGRLEPERALALIGQVAEALDAAHAAGLVHRDVKPGNILVADGPDGGQAYVCDFGLARHLSSVGSLTGERGFVGTIDYVAPEQIEGGAIDGRADIYSLGCVLFECLTGVRPFDRESELSVVFAHLNEPPPLVSHFRPELSEAFNDVLATALAKSPDARYTTCAALVEAAREALHGTPIAQGKRRTRRRLLGLVAIVAAAGATIGGILVSRETEATAASISTSSIAGANLGRSENAYKQFFGIPWRKDRLETPPDYSVLIFHKPKVAAYFEGATDKAVEITTWNKTYRTRAGVGPCSTVAQLKEAYGGQLKAAPWSTIDGKVHGYTIGTSLFFAIGDDLEHVDAVALYDGSAPGARAPGGALPTAAFIALNETPCS